LGRPTFIPPTETPLPLTVTGTLALTAFWLACADELALWLVVELWDAL
jgi:hypothetical protein